MKILIVDDEEIASTSLKRLLRRRGLRKVTTCSEGSKAIDLIKESDFDIVILDLLMPEVDGVQVLQETKPFKPYTEVIVLTAVDDLETATKCIRLGAYDYLLKPVDYDRLLLAMNRALERKGLLCGFNPDAPGLPEDDIPEPFSAIITQSHRMRELLRYAQIMARGGNPVLITGESGTGKELLARGIHAAGVAPEGPFVPVNVSSIPESMFESQFFGYVKGAFTGATADHPGFFEQAHGGTLFLDEIGELPLHLQTAFLRVLEEKQTTRLGDTKSTHFDVQIVSATNVEMDNACREGRFRLDLFYRLKSAHIHLPPLRERGGDIPLLAQHFLQGACKKHNRKIDGCSPEALEILRQRQYPGNIRELAQVVENAVLVSDTSQIFAHHLGEQSPLPSPSTRSLCSFKENHDMHFVFVLHHTRGNLKETAQILGVTLRHAQRQLADLRSDPQYASLVNDI